MKYKPKKMNERKMKMKMDINAVLRKGSTGEDVKTVQKKLRLYVDGVFGSVTEEAVMKFQIAKGLCVDGIVGAETWRALEDEDEMSDSGFRYEGLKKATRRVNKIILHCTATPEGRDVTVEQLRSMHTAPVSKGGRGWSDIGYHYVVYRDGSVHAGRDVNIVGAHCQGQNTCSIGVVYVGGCDREMKAKDTRTEEQKQGMRRLVKRLLMLYGLGTGNVKGHYEYANKACPCFDMDEERREIEKI